MTEQPEKTPRAILSTTETARQLLPGVFLIPTQGNGLVIETELGLVIVDTGGGGAQTEQMIADVRGLSDAPVRAFVFSHAHIGYKAGVPEWMTHIAERGDATPELIAHANYEVRVDRYRETHGWQYLLNCWQFPKSDPAMIEQGLTYTLPTQTFDTELLLDDPVRPVVLRWAPSETDCAVSVWLPNERLLWTGPAVINGFPNIGTPMRVQRLTKRWIDTLDAMIALKPTTLVPEFGPLAHGESASATHLTVYADALRWMWDEVIERINRGMTDVEIIHELDYPPEWRDYAHLAPNYGNPDFVVRDIYRQQGGWWVTRNATDLHPAAPDAAAEAMLSAVDPERVLTRARELHDAGDHQLALHVIDMIAGAPGESEVLLAARTLKGDCCEKLARSNDTFVSRSFYFGSAKLHRSGFRRFSEAEHGPAGLTAR